MLRGWLCWPWSTVALADEERRERLLQAAAPSPQPALLPVEVWFQEEATLVTLMEFLEDAGVFTRPTIILENNSEGGEECRNHPELFIAALCTEAPAAKPTLGARADGTERDDGAHSPRLLGRLSPTRRGAVSVSGAHGACGADTVPASVRGSEEASVDNFGFPANPGRNTSWTCDIDEGEKDEGTEVHTPKGRLPAEDFPSFFVATKPVTVTTHDILDGMLEKLEEDERRSKEDASQQLRQNFARLDEIRRQRDPEKWAKEQNRAAEKRRLTEQWAQEDDAWRVLGLAPGSSRRQLRVRYRQLAGTQHPDKGGDIEACKALQNANEVLTKHFEFRH